MTDYDKKCEDIERKRGLSLLNQWLGLKGFWSETLPKLERVVFPKGSDNLKKCGCVKGFKGCIKHTIEHIEKIIPINQRVSVFERLIEKAKHVRQTHEDILSTIQEFEKNYNYDDSVSKEKADIMGTLFTNGVPPVPKNVLECTETTDFASLFSYELTADPTFARTGVQDKKSGWKDTCGCGYKYTKKDFYGSEYYVREEMVKLCYTHWLEYLETLIRNTYGHFGLIYFYQVRLEHHKQALNERKRNEMIHQQRKNDLQELTTNLLKKFT